MIRTTSSFSERPNTIHLSYLTNLTPTQLLHLLNPTGNLEDYETMSMMLKRYQSKLIDGEYKEPYFYAKDSNTGRLFSHGCSSMKKDIRGYLFHHTTDVDMINAHPTLLFYLCKELKINCPVLECYIRNREEMLRQTGLPREEAKVQFLIALNKDYMDEKVCDVIKQFQTEIISIMNQIIPNERFAYIFEGKTFKPFNVGGSKLNHILCEMENLFLQEIVQFLLNHGISISSLVFDGLMINGNYYNDHNLLRQIEAYLTDKFGIDLKLAYKPHSTMISQRNHKVFTPVLSPSWYTGNIVIQSPMNTHKTQALLKRLRFHLNDHTLLIPNKIVQSYDLVQKLEQVINKGSIWNYKENLPMDGTNFHICSTESMFKKVRNQNYKLVIMDEIVSILAQFKSPTQGELVYNNLKVFTSILQSADSIFAMDADVEQKHLELLEEIAGKKFDFITNTFRDSKKKHYITDHKQTFQHYFIKKVKAGKTIVVCCSSVSQAEKSRQLILAHGGKESEIRVYHTQEDDHTDDFIQGVNETWDKYKYIIYTAKVPNGVSFDKLHFDCCFSYLNNKTLCARELTQMEDRVRNLKDNEIYTYCGKGSTNELPQTIEELEVAYDQRISKMTEFHDKSHHFLNHDIQELKRMSASDPLCKFEKERKILKKIYLMYKLELYQTYRNPMLEYVNKKKQQGRKVIFLHNIDEKDVLIQNKTTSIINAQVRNQCEEDYKAIEIVKDIEAQKAKVQQSKASKQDKMEIKKFEAHRFGYKTDKMPIYTKHEDKLRNRYFFNKNISPDVEKELNKLKTNEIIYRAFPQRCSIIKQIQSLPLETEQQMSTIDFDFKSAYLIFDKELPHRSKKLEKQHLWHCELLNDLLSDFCLEVAKKRKNTNTEDVSGKQIYVYTFKVQDIKLYTELLDEKVEAPVAKPIVQSQQFKPADWVIQSCKHYAERCGYTLDISTPLVKDDNNVVVFKTNDPKCVLKMKIVDGNRITYQLKTV